MAEARADTPDLAALFHRSATVSNIGEPVRSQAVCFANSSPTFASFDLESAIAVLYCLARRLWLFRYPLYKCIEIAYK